MAPICSNESKFACLCEAALSTAFHNRVAAVVNRNRRTLGRVHRLVQNQHRRAQIGRNFQILVELAIQNAPLAVDDVQMRFVGCAQGIDGEGAAFGIGDFTALFEREQNFGEVFFTLRQAGNSGLNVRAAYVFALTDFKSYKSRVMVWVKPRNCWVAATWAAFRSIR